jgi:hypothetical protein
MMFRTHISRLALDLALGRVSFQRWDCNSLGVWELRQAQRLDPVSHMQIRGSDLIINTAVNPWRG